MNGSGIGVSVAVDRLTRTSDRYAARLAGLRDDVRVALAELEEMVREQGRAMGLSEQELDRNAGVVAGVVVRTVVEGVVQHSRRSAGSGVTPPPRPPSDT